MKSWAVVPYLNRVDLTEKVVQDLLDQQGCEMNVLVIQNGHEEFPNMGQRVMIWRHSPPLLSLGSTWNRALEFCWSQGVSEAMVCNNDIRLHKMTYATLSTVIHEARGLLVSAVGVTEAQFDPNQASATFKLTLGFGADDTRIGNKGGPDFSCYLISKDCHQHYPFDERFIPAYCEDLDLHRRMMLGGDGERIFSVNVPYLHIDRGSGTLKAMEPAARAALEQQINQGSRAHYARKWGGPPNEETYREPFSGQPVAGVTTPELQKAMRG